MNKYDFVVTTTLTDRVTVIAEAEDEAKRKILDMLHSNFIPSDLAFQAPRKNAELEHVTENINLTYPDKASALYACESLATAVDVMIKSAKIALKQNHLNQAKYLSQLAGHLTTHASTAKHELALYISYPCCGDEDEQVAVENVDDMNVLLENLKQKLAKAEEAQS